MKLNPNFMMYFGSSTTPPCLENVIHIVVDKPIQVPGCQFKLLRENALVSSKPKEIHTRIEKPKNERIIYMFDKSKWGYMPSVVGIVPQSFNKYLIAHGVAHYKKKYGKYSKWYKKYGRYGKGKGKKPWWAKKYKATMRRPGMDAIDCSIPKN
jgi:hypothetical protein